MHDPITGRWLNRDPLLEAGGSNLLAFVDNDPQDAVDPDGEDKYRPYDYQNRIPNRVTYDPDTGRRQASDGFPLVPNVAAVVFIGACGEVASGVVLLAVPEPTLTKAGGAALTLDGMDKLQGMFRNDRTLFEKAVIGMSGDPNYDPQRWVLVKDLSLTALTIATAAAPGASSRCCSPAAESLASRIGNFIRFETPWGRKVWQRSDIEWSLRRPDGLTNIEAARQGLTPMRKLGDRWEGVQMHHLNQDPVGELAEVWTSTHQRLPHNVPPPSWPVSDPAAAAAFRREVPAYWRWRAGQIGGER